jgi:hypothetical protein
MNASLNTSTQAIGAIVIAMSEKAHDRNTDLEVNWAAALHNRDSKADSPPKVA